MKKHKGRDWLDWVGFAAFAALVLVVLVAHTLAQPALAPEDMLQLGMPRGLVYDSAAAFKVYVALDGDDAAPGLSPGRPVATLARAHAVLCALRPRRDVEIRIAPGRYAQREPVVWTYWHPVYRMSLMPLDYRGEPAEEIKDRPVFVGDLTRDDGWWFDLEVQGGHASNVRIYGIEIRDYLNGLKFVGQRPDDPNYPAGWNGGNVIYGCRFVGLGNLHRRGHTGGPMVSWGRAAISLVNSRNNIIEDCTFERLENIEPERVYVHAIYMLHGSSGNMIRRCAFRHVSGAPLKFSNASNANYVVDCVFEATGWREGGRVYGALAADAPCGWPDNMASWCNVLRGCRVEGGQLREGERTSCFEHGGAIPAGQTDYGEVGWERFIEEGGGPTTRRSGPSSLEG